ncbi:fructosamine kinase family protein [Nitrosomonas sp. ANs5]|uniref:fructosamine kinase family protein n=1 Tax=Nitrosomonas sp. ANs5 TaxID=3423941 RepID=UPI003D34CBFC
MKRHSLDPLSASPWPAITAQISEQTGRVFVAQQIAPVGGGCINRAYRIQGVNQQFFVKLNQAHYLPMFEAEAAGLEEIRNAAALRAPQPLCSGCGEGHAWLVLEFLDLRGQGDDTALGTGLARMHRHTSDKYGWVRDNTIGSSPQINRPASDWIAFWRQQRLAYQLNLAQENGYGGRLQLLGEQLIDGCPHFFTGPGPRPSLLHGDLWSGNYAFDASRQPVIFDPAVYYGDREADLAMTELFGGFPSDFYAAYRESWPLEAGYHTRKQLYNLYHILNHLNLFGGHYLRQAETMMARLLAEIR